MRKLLLALFAALIVAACTNTTDEPAPDAAPFVNLDAARLDAEAVCDRRIACDPTYTVDLATCTEHVAEQLCLANAIDCRDDAPYTRLGELEACLADYRALACDAYAPICEL